MRRFASAWLAPLILLAGCSGKTEAPAGPPTIPVTIEGASGRHVFRAELADTPEEQARGLMFRTNLADDFAMLFAPYPPTGGPREASFWMKNTPSSLDILYIRADGTVARIAENAVPLSEAPIPSGEPVAAVLEVRGGRSAELGIGEGDRVSWPAMEGAKGGGN